MAATVTRSQPNWDVVERELRALDVHPTNLHQLLDTILSIWANISNDLFQHIVVLKSTTLLCRRKGIKHSISMVYIYIYIYNVFFFI